MKPYCKVLPYIYLQREVILSRDYWMISCVLTEFLLKKFVNMVTT